MECTKKHYLFLTIVLGILSTSLIIAICLVKSKENDKTCAGGDQCLKKECLEAAAMILNSRNTSVNPCDDFYEHSCGNWIATHEISPRDNAAGVFLSLRDILDERLRDLLEGTYEDILTSIKQAKTLFHSCDDIYSIEQLNITNVITNTFNRYIDNDMIKLLSLYGGRGLAPITVTQDTKNSSIIKIYFSWINPILKRNQTNKEQFQNLVEGFQDLIDVNTVINMETKILNMTYLNVENEKVTLEDLSNETAVSQLLKQIHLSD
ncbi:membrane metallo-endopeptidase-like 1 [Octopus sinensis]|uniref:Membrane metallo-endopeptidase-like 1 n=1 Tax=Octopus sinensis TaxID=2607531 RepID=A0A6P7SYX8_9MOLL|nr:membrane metallo-endopeptidase-like 1 [Octopus sinensis]